jgi:hypothetical protein
MEMIFLFRRGWAQAVETGVNALVSVGRLMEFLTALGQACGLR